MLNLTELMAADDYLNWILPKCVLVRVRKMRKVNYVSTYVCSYQKKYMKNYIILHNKNIIAYSVFV